MCTSVKSPRPDDTSQVELGGIPAGRTHGLHIHTGAATDEASCGAEVTGGHYNPLGRAHSGPQSNILERHVYLAVARRRRPSVCGLVCSNDVKAVLERSSLSRVFLGRHVGDFGNIASDETGTVNVSLESEDVYLWGPYSVVGRAWVLHAGVDDLGLGGDNASLTTGFKKPLSPPAVHLDGV